MTNSWTDIKNTDLIIVMGGNAAEAHPCGFKWVTEAKAQRGAKLIVVDPRRGLLGDVPDGCLIGIRGTDRQQSLMLLGRQSDACGMSFAKRQKPPDRVAEFGQRRVVGIVQ